MRKYLSAAAFLLALLAPARATGQSTVWVSVLNDIRAVNTANGSSQRVHLSSGSAAGDLVFGPDGLLYFGEHFPADNRSCVSRVNPSGAVKQGVNATYQKVACHLLPPPPNPPVPVSIPLNDPKELRFDSTGALLFATATSGVRKIAAAGLASCPASPAACNLNASLIPNTGRTVPDTGSGLDHTADGSLLFTDGEFIKREPTLSGFPLDAINPVVGVEVATGGLGSILPSMFFPPGPTSTSPTGAICASAGIVITCRKKADTAISTTLATFGPLATQDKPQWWEFAKDDTAWVAVSVDPNNVLTSGQMKALGVDHNGLLVKVTGINQKTVVYPTNFNGPQPPITGVALPPTSKLFIELDPTSSRSLDFGDDVLEVNTQNSCRLKVTVFERLTSEVQPCLNSAGPQPPPVPPFLSPATYLGESFPTEYFLEQLSNCDLPTPAPVETRILAFFPGGTSQNLAMVRRPSGACQNVTTGTFALATHDDQADEGSAVDPSGWMGALVKVAAAPPGITLLSPLQDALLIPPATLAQSLSAAPVHNLGNLAVKFSLTSGLLTSEALFSIQRLGEVTFDSTGTPMFSDPVFCNPTATDNPTLPPKFFVTGESHMRFNLNTNAMTPSECTLPGVYALGISFPFTGEASAATFLVRFR